MKQWLFTSLDPRLREEQDLVYRVPAEFLVPRGYRYVADAQMLWNKWKQLLFHPFPVEVYQEEAN